MPKIPTIFISYSDDDRKLATELRNHLNMKFGDESAILAPRQTAEAISIPEHVAKLIEASHYFISLCPQKPKECVPWVQQELGYAYSIARRGFLKIILIYGDRESLEGFISKGSHHLAEGFDLSQKSSEDIWEDVSGYIARERIFPLWITNVDLDVFEGPAQRGDVYEHIFKFRVFIENRCQDVLEDVTLDFVSLRSTVFEGYSLKYQTDMLAEYQRDEPSLTYHPLLVLREIPIPGKLGSRKMVAISATSRGIPSELDKRFEKKKIPPVFRRTYFIGRLPPISVVEFPFVLKVFTNKQEPCEADLVLYLQVPRFGYEMYQLMVRPGNERLSIEPRYEPAELRIRILGSV